MVLTIEDVLEPIIEDNFFRLSKKNKKEPLSKNDRPAFTLIPFSDYAKKLRKIYLSTGN